MLRSTAVMFVTLPSILVSALVLWYTHSHRKREKGCVTPPQVSPHTQTRTQVLFFPDSATAQSLSSGLMPPEASADHGSLSVLIRTLQSARKSLDVCVFVISCRELAEVLISAHSNGVVVRVISDNEQVFASGSQIEALRRKGIQVRNDSASYYMHHKFAVVDNEVLINGSLNWTLQGVCGNQENAVISAIPDMVAPFSRHFEKLWEKYDPENSMY